MCVIAISEKGKRQPSKKELETMFNYNPDGAGFMVARNNRVIISKGYMIFSDYWRAIQAERFTDSDIVVYHCRISTQAGTGPEMTQPFPLNSDLRRMEYLDTSCSIGIAHNGIIPLTSNSREKRFSDTALYIANYLTKIIRKPHDLNIPEISEIISGTIGHSKLAILTANGAIHTIGKFTEHNGILLSNLNHLQPETIYKTQCKYAAYDSLFDRLEAERKII